MLVAFANKTVNYRVIYENTFGKHSLTLCGERRVWMGSCKSTCAIYIRVILHSLLDRQ